MIDRLTSATNAAHAAANGMTGKQSVVLGYVISGGCRGNDSLQKGCAHPVNKCHDSREMVQNAAAR